VLTTFLLYLALFPFSEIVSQIRAAVSHNAENKTVVATADSNTFFLGRR